MSTCFPQMAMSATSKAPGMTASNPGNRASVPLLNRNTKLRAKTMPNTKNDGSISLVNRQVASSVDSSGARSSLPSAFWVAKMSRQMLNNR